ncbi:hypothetical protein BDC45DRAFT_148191 [Circinella umbellata]|nr:hypothetical protein BDC45DRAFT_148191 [Circinella umbellata]
MNRHNSDIMSNAYTNNNINNTRTRNSDNSHSRSTVSITTTQPSNFNHHSNNNNSNHASISSGSSYASAITIVDEDETKSITPSIDDLLGDLQSLTIQQKQTAHTRTSSYEKQQQLEVKTLNQEYLAAKRAALKRVQSPLAKKWDELYEKTSIVKVPSVKPLSAEEEALVSDSEIRITLFC